MEEVMEKQGTSGEEKLRQKAVAIGTVEGNRVVVEVHLLCEHFFGKVIEVVLEGVEGNELHNVSHGLFSTRRQRLVVGVESSLLVCLC